MNSSSYTQLPTVIVAETFFGLCQQGIEFSVYHTASYHNAIAVGLELVVADLLREHTLKGDLTSPAGRLMVSVQGGRIDE